MVVGEFVKGPSGEKNLKIIGAGEVPSVGVRHGYIVDQSLAAAALEEAITLAEQSSGVRIRRAFISVSGLTLRSETSSGLSIVSKADGEVTELDRNKALADCEENLNLNNKKVIQVFPVSYRLDGKEVLGRLEGMRGTKLEIKAVFVNYSMQHLEDLIGVVTLSGVETIDVIAAPLAQSTLVLSDRQKIAGVALVDIGSQTTTLSVFENEKLTYAYTFSIGSADITNDIALGFKISLEEAENLKRGEDNEEFSKKKLEEIIEARLSDIFEVIENHLKKIKRSELLPAGIVFVGGGAHTLLLTEFSKSILKLPSCVGSTEIFGSTKTKLRDPSWFTALGLLTASKDGNGYPRNSFMSLIKDIKSTIKSGIKQLMP